MADDELALRRAMDRAAKAQALVDDEILKEAFTTLRQSYVDAWMATDARDTDGRERLWAATTVLTKVRDHLDRMISDGMVAEAQLRFNEDKARRSKRA